jgi:hypothetical protein
LYCHGHLALNLYCHGHLALNLYCHGHLSTAAGTGTWPLLLLWQHHACQMRPKTLKRTPKNISALSMCAYAAAAAAAAEDLSELPAWQKGLLLAGGLAVAALSLGVLWCWYRGEAAAAPFTAKRAAVGVFTLRCLYLVLTRSPAGACSCLSVHDSETNKHECVVLFLHTIGALSLCCSSRRAFA